LIQESKSHPHKSTAFLVPILLLHSHLVYVSKMISCRFSDERFCVSILPVRATRPLISSSLNTTVFPLERLTVARIAKKFLSSYYPEGSLPCSHQSTTELHSVPAKLKFFILFYHPNNICLYFRYFVRAQGSAQIPGFKRVVLEV
jgi:hypothetical protein